MPTYFSHTWTDPISTFFQGNSPEFWFFLPVSPLSSPLSPLPGFTLLCAHLLTSVKTDLPVRWSSDTGHSNWAPGYDGTAYFSLCRPFSCGKGQKKVRHQCGNASIPLTFLECLPRARHSPRWWDRQISPAPGADTLVGRGRKQIRNVIIK